MSHRLRKPTIWVSEQVRHRPVCTVTEDEEKLEILDVRRRGFTICVVNTKTLISCAVTAQLICIFIFAITNCWFSHATAQMIRINQMPMGHEAHLSLQLLLNVKFMAKYLCNQTIWTKCHMQGKGISINIYAKTKFKYSKCDDRNSQFPLFPL